MTNNEVMEYMENHNTTKYKIRKAYEELSELTTVLIQYYNKPYKVSPDEIIEELGDVEIRLPAIKKLFGEEKVAERVNFKLQQKYAKYIEEGKYEGKI